MSFSTATSGKQAVFLHLGSGFAREQRMYAFVLASAWWILPTVSERSCSQTRVYSTVDNSYSCLYNYCHFMQYALFTVEWFFYRLLVCLLKRSVQNLLFLCDVFSVRTCRIVSSRGSTVTILLKWPFRATVIYTVPERCLPAVSILPTTLAAHGKRHVK